MKIDILTLFPDMFKPIIGDSILGKAQEKNIIDINPINIRDYSSNKHKSVDDYTFGGGEGMVMQAQPIDDAMKAIEALGKTVIYMTPKGKIFNHEKALELAKKDNLVILCGHYEGIDQRVLDKWVTEEISIGDYVLTGGEIPAMVLVDSVCRLVDGVLSSEEAYSEESIASGLLEYPQYSRPREYDGVSVPEVLVSGNHKKIKEWRFLKALELTFERRKDLFDKFLRKKDTLPKNEKKILDEFVKSNKK